jgi:hypothetical protein
MKTLKFSSSLGEKDVRHVVFSSGVWSPFQASSKCNCYPVLAELDQEDRIVLQLAIGVALMLINFKLQCGVSRDAHHMSSAQARSQMSQVPSQMPSYHL